MNGKNQKSILSCKTAAIILGLLASENSVVRSATLKEMEVADIGSKAELLSALRMWMDEAQQSSADHKLDLDMELALILDAY